MSFYIPYSGISISNEYLIQSAFQISPSTRRTNETHITFRYIKQRSGRFGVALRSSWDPKSSHRDYIGILKLKSKQSTCSWLQVPYPLLVALSKLAVNGAGRVRLKETSGTPFHWLSPRDAHCDLFHRTIVRPVAIMLKTSIIKTLLGKATQYGFFSLRLGPFNRGKCFGLCCLWGGLHM